MHQHQNNYIHTFTTSDDSKSSSQHTAKPFIIVMDKLLINISIPSKENGKFINNLLKYTHD